MRDAAPKSRRMGELISGLQADDDLDYMRKKRRDSAEEMQSKILKGNFGVNGLNSVTDTE